MLSILINSTLGFLKKHPDVVRSMNTSSMTQYTKSTRSEPITMIDQNIANLEEMPDLMATLTSIYAAMYAQSFSIAINHEIGDVKVLQTLDKINPNRSKMEGVLALAGGLSLEQLSLPDYTKDIVSNESVISFEAVKVKNDKTSWHSAAANVYDDVQQRRADKKNGVKPKQGNGKATAEDDDTEKPNKDRTESSTDIQAISQFMSNLSTGILFEVTVEADHRKVSIPISVRLLANRMPSQMLINLFTAAVRNQTAKERFREWRSGGINLWSDVILCRDILKTYRTNLIKDSSGMFNEVLRRKASNQVAGAISGNPSISQISNIVIVSTETMETFERESSKKLNQGNTRDLIFNNTQTLILAVVNRTRETVTLHYHDISVPTTVTFKELKSSGGKSGGGPDVMEILKAYQMGNGINL